MKKILNIITPTYDYPRFRSVVQRGIASILSQNSHDFEVRHLVVFDGPLDSGFSIENPPDWYHVESYDTPATHVWGIAQRNFGITLVNEGWVWFFDHDNIFYPGAFSKVSAALESDTGVLIFRARHLHGNETLFGRSSDIVIPVNLDQAPKYSEMDSLNFVIHSSIVGFGEWQEKWGHDFLYSQNMVTIAQAIGLKVKRMDFIVGEHS